MTRRGDSWRSGPGRGRFPRRCGAHSSTGTGAAASRAAESGSARGITCATGRKGGRPRSATSPCSVASTTAPSTKRATRSSASPMGRSGSGGRTAGPCPTSRSRPRCPPIRSRPCARTTRRKGFASTRGQHARLAGGAPGSGLGNRCPASPGHASRGIFQGRVTSALGAMIASPACVLAPAPMARDPSDRIVSLAFLLACSGS